VFLHGGAIARLHHVAVMRLVHGPRRAIRNLDLERSRHGLHDREGAAFEVRFLHRPLHGVVANHVVVFRDRPLTRLFPGKVAGLAVGLIRGVLFGLLPRFVTGAIADLLLPFDHRLIADGFHGCRAALFRGDTPFRVTAHAAMVRLHGAGEP